MYVSMLKAPYHIPFPYIMAYFCPPELISLGLVNPERFTKSKVLDLRVDGEALRHSQKWGPSARMRSAETALVDETAVESEASSAAIKFALKFGRIGKLEVITDSDILFAVW